MGKFSLKQLSTKLSKLGPGSLVTAAFIGPGTITTCSLAGAGFGMALLWGLTFSVIATIVLQEMSARLGIITQKGLGESIRLQLSSPTSRVLAAILIISAIAIGNAAYETGNLLGSAMGLSTIINYNNTSHISIIIGLIAFVLLAIGNYRMLEKALIGLVLIMSIVFISTAFIIGPNTVEILKGMFIPSLPDNSALMVIGLIGTTVVPYNLFLHASAVQERWKKPEHLGEARFDLVFSIIMGGIISMTIIITSAMAFYSTRISISGAADLAVQLEPVLGTWAKYFLALGLFAAGISSSITAPLAAAYATCGILGWKKDLKSLRFKLIWMIILGIGVIFAGFGYKPLKAILFAQVTNGVLLPVIAIFLVVVMNNKSLLGQYANGRLSNILGILIVLVAIGLGLKSILSVFGLI
ncbi:Nramp family divalent metal transporter [Carboxylicivirga sp. N1Y90]|uniref:Nramp family divalent metal transporter n=1 Tax=Carboxylicivirga fragile TaxID=3417571 RepID=UPI003D351ECC|nr:Nramp family divalent metal transporter [Marinilabiliaceae bacterium N1Y90]